MLVGLAAYKECGSRWAALAGATLGSTATPFDYLQVEFDSTLAGLIAVFSALLMLAVHLRSRRIDSLVLGLGCLLTAALSHITTAVIALLIACDIYLSSLGTVGLGWSRRWWAACPGWRHLC